MNTIELVAKFFRMLDQLPIDVKSDLFADPHTYELVSYEGSAIVIHRSAVWHLFNYHFGVLTLQMLEDKEMMTAMADIFDGNTWAQYGRPGLLDIVDKCFIEAQFKEIISSF